MIDITIMFTHSFNSRSNSLAHPRNRYQIQHMNTFRAAPTFALQFEFAFGLPELALEKEHAKASCRCAHASVTPSSKNTM
jgi:hypothetical protein